jgi:superfamily II DNA or RNA helicase
MIDLDSELPLPGLMQLREYQVECLDKIREASKTFNRILCVLVGGAGKTILFSQTTREEVAAGGRVLILAHSDELLEQALDKLKRSTGLDADREKADDHASPYAQVVIASVQTLSKENRLRGFPDNHFTLIHIDETHRIMSPSHQRVVNYFTYGEESLVEGWELPGPEVPQKNKTRAIGWTATASRGDKKELGSWFQTCAYDYGLIEAVRDGYLIKPIVKNIPIKIDLRGIKVSRSSNGADLDLGEVIARITPFLREIAKQFQIHAATMKAVVFMPSVETARLLAEAMREQGLNAMFVSGACQDREEKIQHYRDFRGPIILTCALLVVEGFDVPDIDCVCILRPTKIWSFYVQASVRGTRTLPGVIDGLKTREERLAAIAASAKPFFTILDFLWLSDRLDLVTPFDLVTTKQGVKDKMVENAAGSDEIDLMAGEQVAERDFLAALEKEAKRHARKASRVIDPIAWAVSLGDTELAGWEPMTKWDELPPTEGQLRFLKQHHVDTSKVIYRGLATKMTLRLIQRLKSGLASYEQMTFLKNLGYTDKDTLMLTRSDASALIDKTLKDKKARRLERQAEVLDLDV